LCIHAHLHKLFQGNRSSGSRFVRAFVLLSPRSWSNLALRRKNSCRRRTARMTVLFSDVRGFTTIFRALKHDFRRADRLMNRFYAADERHHRTQGTIDKYIATRSWHSGTPPLMTATGDHACEAALEILLVRTSSIRSSNEAALNGGNIHAAQCRDRVEYQDLRSSGTWDRLPLQLFSVGRHGQVASRLRDARRITASPFVIGAGTNNAPKKIRDDGDRPDFR